MYRREALDEAGFFDDDFFAYCEDTDLGLRLRFAGWKAFAAPSARVIHHYSKTLGRFSPEKLRLVERNHFWVALKNFPLPLLPLVPLFTFRRYITALLMAMRKNPGVEDVFDGAGRFALASAVVRAWVEAIKKAPAMLMKRRSVVKAGTISFFQKLSLLKRFSLSDREIMGGR